MKPYLMSVQFGNWRGYAGKKEELEDMIKQIKEDTKNDKVEINTKETDGEVVVEYWSKW